MDVIFGRNGEVAHSPAAFADEMVVLIHRCIVPMDPFSEIEFLNSALRREDVKVSVNRTERDARNLLTNVFVHPFRGRV